MSVVSEKKIEAHHSISSNPNDSAPKVKSRPFIPDQFKTDKGEIIVDCNFEKDENRLVPR